MCTICMATATFDPARHLDENGVTDPALANIVEGADAAAGTNTNYGMQVGDTFSGDLDSNGDRDWVAISLEGGQSYDIDVLAAGAGAGTLGDSYLRIYDANGNLVATNDDGGVNRDSSLTFSATSDGVYFISVGAYADNYTGTYQVTVDQVAPPQAASLDEMANYLTDGYWNDQGFSGFRFDTSASNEITVNITALTPEGQQLARWAFETWEMVANIRFVEVTGTAQINFDDNQPGAFAGPDNVVNGFTTTAVVNVSTAWLATYGTTLDSYSFSTYVHEIGHALGLGHQGNYNGNATYGQDETFSNDSYQLSVMSYFSQTQNTTVNASYAELLTAMMVDIIAIQNLYGAPGASSETAGDTTWGANTTLSNYLADAFDAIAGGSGNGNMSGNPVALTIYDHSGIDTVDLSYSTTNDRIDLREEQFSDIGGLIGNVGIARGTVLENLIAGSGNNTITGNAADNSINAGAGNDTASGGAGRDTLLGGNGQDVLRGGIDFDELRGGNDNDTLIGENGRDTMFGEAGNDVLQDNGQRGPLGRDLFYGQNGNDTIFGGGANDTAHGGNGNDVMYGGLDNDLLYGGNQFDLLFGQLGDDTLFGGNGRDTMRGGNGNDELIDNGQGGDLGRDLFFGENGNDTVRGGGGNDTAHGGNGNDQLFGGVGNDEIFGGANYDFIHGNADDDVLYGGNGRDTVNGGNGDDEIIDNAQGGVHGADIFLGEAGDDTIRIGGGNDTATGGAGSDTFVFAAGHGNDVITDFDALDGDEDIDLRAITAIADIDQLLAAATQVGNDVRIDTGGGNSILLEGVTRADLDDSDFIFA